MRSIALGQAEIEVLEKPAALVRTLHSERDKLASELAEYRRKDLAGEIVFNMERKGLSDPTIPFRKRLDSLLASGESLDVVKKASELASSNSDLGSLADGHGSDDDVSSSDALMEFLLS